MSQFRALREKGRLSSRCVKLRLSVAVINSGSRAWLSRIAAQNKREASGENLMATIIPFRKHQTASRSAPKRNATPAKIVIFPGVRYERTGAQGTAVPQPARTSRKRRESVD
jgi:hypothetical protein